MSSSGSFLPSPLVVTGYFNPVDCRSLGIIRTTLASMCDGETLEVVANHFQSEEIRSWTRKFHHEIVSIRDADGLVFLLIRKNGMKP